MNIIQNMQDTRDMNKCSVKYIGIDQSSNKGIYKINVKKDLQCSFKTMNIWSTENISIRISS